MVNGRSTRLEVRVPHGLAGRVRRVAEGWSEQSGYPVTTSDVLREAIVVYLGITEAAVSGGAAYGARSTGSTTERSEPRLRSESTVPGRPQGSVGGESVAEPSHMQGAAARKVGRNALCPCGSGKKYKRCHGHP